MITSNVYQRVFYLQYMDSTGTCFALDIDMKQYIVTARHVVDGIKDRDKVSIFYKNQWHIGDVRVIGMGSNEDLSNDIAILAVEHRVAPAVPLEATSAGVVYGQDVFFLGFPYGLYTDTEIMRGFPLPLVKKGTMSGSLGQQEVFLLDGQNNPGFSGGPVVFTPVGSPKLEYRVMGVVSAYRCQEGDVYYKGKPTGLKHAENAGIILAPSIKRVTDLIAKNPVGFVLG